MATSNKPLAGKVAFVTGAARNIGRAIALGLAEDGADLVINAHSAEAELQAVAEEARAMGVRVLARVADVSNEKAVQALVTDAVGEFGRLDILVNNAARRQVVGTLETTTEFWHEILGTILDGTFLCCRTALPHLIESGSGRIVNFGGASAHRGADDRIAVMTAKAGIIGLTRSLAFDFSKHGVTANCIVPGGIETVRGAAAGKGENWSESPLLRTGRRGRPSEIADTVRFLCSPGAGYITGQTIHVSGGMFFGG